MALWNGLSQAATVAQLAGVDAGGLITMIVQAVQTVRRNREECRHLMHQVMMISDLLQMLQQSESETMQRPEIRRPLDGLEDTLRQAYTLVLSCQESNIMFRFLMGGTHAQKFRDIRDRIDSYLRLYPLVSHIDTRVLITRLYSRAHPSVTPPQASEEVPGSSSASHANPDSRNQGSVSVDDDTESGEVGAVNEPFAVQEQHLDGSSFDYANTEALPNRRRRFRWFFQWAQREPSRPQSLHGFFDHKETGGLTVFKFSELAKASNNFSTLVGQGGYGSVYRGVLPNGAPVAIKTLRSFGESIQHEEFAKEVQIIPKLQHANVIKLLGCCTEGDNRILVYEYALKGSLDHMIQELKAGVSMAWPLRFHIIEGIAQGVVYLHQYSRVRIVHGDIKPSNILLDRDMTPWISDFGSSEILTSDEYMIDMIRGTVGYVDPELIETMIVSTKSDVYAFGVTCLEIITAQRAIDYYSEAGRQPLTQHAWELWSSGRAMELIDPSLHDDPEISKILRCLQIVLLCVQPNRADRPTMLDVLLMLKCESMILPLPMSCGAGESSADAYYGAELNTQDGGDDETSSY